MDKEKLKYLLNRLPEQDKNTINNLMNAAGFIREDLLIEQFYLIVDRIAFLVQELFKNIECNSGCSLCCTENGNPEISSAEWQLISEELDGLPVTTREKIISNLKNTLLSSEKNNFTCPLLVEGKCTIYPYRPLSCRTTGYFLKENKTEKLKILGSENNLIPQTCSKERLRWNQELSLNQLTQYLYIFLPVAEKFEAALDKINNDKSIRFFLALKLREKLLS